MTLRLKRVKKNCLRRKRVGDEGLLDVTSSTSPRDAHQEAHIVGNVP